MRRGDLTQLSTRDAFAELLRSRLALERRLGHPVQWLAYPFGRFDALVERLARHAGYVLATTTSPECVSRCARRSRSAGCGCST